MHCLLQRHFTATGGYVWTFPRRMFASGTWLWSTDFCQGSGNALTCPFNYSAFRTPTLNGLFAPSQWSTMTLEGPPSAFRAAHGLTRAWLVLVCPCRSAETGIRAIAHLHGRGQACAVAASVLHLSRLSKAEARCRCFLQSRGLGELIKFAVTSRTSAIRLPFGYSGDLRRLALVRVRKMGRRQGPVGGGRDGETTGGAAFKNED